VRRWLYGALVLLAATSCKKANPDYCCTAADCAEQSACPDGLFCDNEGAYGDLSNSCVEPPGEPCSESSPCDGDAICHDGLCVECEEGFHCSEVAPVCGEDFTCGECAGNEDCGRFTSSPVCGEDGACRACASGDECESGVCDTAGGGCVAAEHVLYVDGDALGDMCTAVGPCNTIQEAVDLAAGDRIWILVAEGSYAETLTLDGVTVRIIAHGADLVPGAALMSAVVVRAGADVLIEGLRIHDASGTGSGGDGINCANDVESPVLRVHRATIENNADEGIDALACTVEVTRSVLRGNDGGALKLEESDFTIINDFIYENGDADAAGGVTVRGNPPGGAAAARLEHNTIVRNSGPDAVVAGVTCAEVTSTLTFRNNLIWGNNATAPAEVVGASCAHESSLIGPTAADGDGNLNEAPSYVSQGSDDYRLDRGSSGIDAAADSDVVIDHEGDPRPAGDGPDIGADERAL
jgi:hypothetical protein